MNLSILITELTTDPLARGYSGMSAAEARADLNSLYRSRDKSTMTSSDVLNAVDKTEFNALSDADKQIIWNILHIGEVDPFGIEAALFIDIFGGGSDTITNLQDLRKEPISRAAELNLGIVKEGYVILARS